MVEVVLIFSVVLEPKGIFLQQRALQGANHALVLQVIVDGLILISYFSESVNHHSEYDVQQNQVHCCPNAEVEEPSDEKVDFFLKTDVRYDISNRSRRTGSQRQDAQETVWNGRANILSQILLEEIWVEVDESED